MASDTGIFKGNYETNSTAWTEYELYTWVVWVGGEPHKVRGQYHCSNVTLRACIACHRFVRQPLDRDYFARHARVALAVVGRGTNILLQLGVGSRDIATSCRPAGSAAAAPNHYIRGGKCLPCHDVVYSSSFLSMCSYRLLPISAHGNTGH